MTQIVATTGGAFVLCGRTHWLVIVVIAASSAWLSLLLRRAAGRPFEPFVRRTVCWSLAGVVAAAAVAKLAHEATSGTFSVQDSLPLHLCDIALLVVGVALVGAGLEPGRQPSGPRPGRHVAPVDGRRRAGPRCQRLYELAYFWGLGGTVQAVLTPDLDEGFPNLACIRYFVTHGAIVVGVLVMTIGLRMRPQPGSAARVWLLTLALACAVMLFNWATDSNYMYLCGPPDHPSIIDYFGPWPWSLLTLVFVGTLFIVLCYAPFWVIDHRHRRQATSENRSG